MIVAPASASVSAPVASTGAIARRSGGEPRLIRKPKITSAAATIAKPSQRCARSNSLAIPASPWISARFAGTGRNVSVTNCPATTSTYNAMTSARSSVECSRPSGKASTVCVNTALAQLPVAYPIVNSTPAVEAGSPPRNHKNPVTSISGPIRLSGR